MRFRKYDAEKHSFQRGIKSISRIQVSCKPEEERIPECLHEENNPYDVFFIKVCKSNNAQSAVGHLLMEILRITKFILYRSAKVQATVTGKHYHRSPLVQGGLEVPCLVTVTMPRSIMNHLLIAQYEKLLGELYLEPKDEEIMGTFLSVICENDFVGTNQYTPCEASSSTKNKKKAEVRSRDTRNMFRMKNKRCYTVVSDWVLEIYTWYFEGCLFYPLYLINLAFFAGIDFCEFQL